MGSFLGTHKVEKMLPMMVLGLEVLLGEGVQARLGSYDSDGYQDAGIKVEFFILGKKPNYPYEKYGTFSLTDFPGNGGLVVSHSLYLTENTRGNGVAKLLQRYKEDIARAYGFSGMVCTTMKDNNIENHILETHGWKKVNKFINRRTGHHCIEWYKDITYAENET